MRKTLRVVAVVGVWAAISIVGPAADAHHSIVLTPCSSGNPDPSPTSPPSSPNPSPGPSPTPDPGPDNCVPPETTRMIGTRTLQWSVIASQSRPIERVDMYLLSEEEGVPSPNERGPVFSEQYRSQRDAPPAKTYQFTWNTVSLTPYNGKYKVLVIASTYGQHPEGPKIVSAERHDLRVDNPPNPIGPPRIIAKTETSVSVEWDKALEPDVLSYTLYRAKSSDVKKPPAPSAFKPILTTSAISTRDSVAKGNYWYAIQVTRRSVVTPQTGISSPVSTMSAPAAVTGVEAPPPPKKGTKGSGKGSGSGTGSSGGYVPRVFSKLPHLTAPSFDRRPPPVPDAPYSAYLPYDVPEGGSNQAAAAPAPREVGADPRGPVLPVAVGAFLVSSALALGRMPY